MTFCGIALPGSQVRQPRWTGVKAPSLSVGAGVRRVTLVSCDSSGGGGLVDLLSPGCVASRSGVMDALVTGEGAEWEQEREFQMQTEQRVASERTLGRGGGGVP
jgi:hypothetical protein